MSFRGSFRKGDLASGKQALIKWPSGQVWEGKWTLDMNEGKYRFENTKHRSPRELYVWAGRLLDEEDEFLARLILRHIADRHPSSDTGRRAVDRLVSLREHEELKTLEAGRLRAIEQAERNRAWDEQATRLREETRRRQAHDDARRACRASCEGKSHEGFFSDYNACVSRCP